MFKIYKNAQLMLDEDSQFTTLTNIFFEKYEGRKIPQFLDAENEVGYTPLRVDYFFDEEYKTLFNRFENYSQNLEDAKMDISELVLRNIFSGGVLSVFEVDPIEIPEPINVMKGFFSAKGYIDKDFKPRSTFGISLENSTKDVNKNFNTMAIIHEALPLVDREMYSMISFYKGPDYFLQPFHSYQPFTRRQYKHLLLDQ